MILKEGVASKANPGIAERVSTLGFPVTFDHVTTAIERAGLTIFARIDHAADAREAGLAMPPTVVLLYGHAMGGTPIGARPAVAGARAQGR